MSLPPSWRTNRFHPGAGAPVAKSTASTSRAPREPSQVASRTVAASFGFACGPAAGTGAARNALPEEEVPQPDKAVASPRIKPNRHNPVIAHPPARSLGIYPGEHRRVPARVSPEREVTE